ncbi:hypothetical protein [Sphingosinicella terrae]|uniref:hypothetical protein n=1 Tax=Sphingosinicella terrae TaxID=2172047 RepID=UPI0013B3E67B|nr:hypothetical protein [Sphingosinicella terrae]
MRIMLVPAIAAAFLVGACGGGGQTETTEAEEALGNGFQPAAPSPGTAGDPGMGGNTLATATGLSPATDGGATGSHPADGGNAQ